MMSYCPNCRAHVKEDERGCHECKTDIEPLNRRSYFEKLVNALNHPERTTRIRAAYILGELRDRRAIPVNRALISFAVENGVNINESLREYQRTYQKPFSSEERYMACGYDHVYKKQQRKADLFCQGRSRGSFEEVQ